MIIFLGFSSHVYAYHMAAMAIMAPAPECPGVQCSLPPETTSGAGHFRGIWMVPAFGPWLWELNELNLDIYLHYLRAIRAIPNSDEMLQHALDISAS